MNFLQLVQRGAREADLPGANAASVTAATGDVALLAGWISDCWVNLQKQPKDWRWLRDRFTGAALTPTVGAYRGTTLYGARFSGFLEGEAGVVSITDPISTGTHFLAWLDYERFRRAYLVGAQTPGTPVAWSVAPDGQLLVGPEPDRAYTLDAEVRKTAQRLESDADVPECPEDHHMILVWKALLDDAAGFDAAPDVATRAANKYEEMLRALEVEQSMARFSVRTEPLDVY